MPDPLGPRRSRIAIFLSPWASREIVSSGNTKGFSTRSASDPVDVIPPQFLCQRSLGGRGTVLATLPLPARRTHWGNVVKAHEDREIFKMSPDHLPEIDIHSPSS
jgi:hypothetical protein